MKRKTKKTKYTEEQIQFQEFIKILSHNQRTTYEMIMALQKQVTCLEMKINLMERRLWG
jgi:GTP cyclohydrolase FolE2